jgi:hypothetical protein
MNDKPQLAPASATKLLQAASELLGGDTLLAQELGITPSLLGRFLSGRVEVPANVFLQAVDIVDARTPVFPLGAPPGSGRAGQSDA